MRWYNPKTRSSETVTAPRTDEEAERMLRGHRDSGAFLTRFEQLRADGMSVEQAISLWGTTSGCGTWSFGQPGRRYRVRQGPGTPVRSAGPVPRG